MIRASLVAFVVLVAILAFVLDYTWLYVVSGVSLLVTLGWFAVYGWSAYHRRKRDAARQDSDREHRLQDFGIVSIRPQEKASSGASPSSPAASPSNPSSASSASSGPSSGSSPSDKPRPVASSKEKQTAAQGNGSSPSTTGAAATARTSADRPADRSAGQSAGQSDDDGGASGSADGSASGAAADPASGAESGAGASGARAADTAVAEAPDTGITTSPRADEPVLVPLVESLRAAVEAYSVCLLVQEDVVLEYHIRAIASRSAAVQRDGAFSTSDPLLTASMSRQPITVRRIEGGRNVVAGYLRYYEDPPTIDHIALAPVPIRDTATTTFLLVDATDNSDLGAPNARAIIEQYAETVALVLQSGATASAEKPSSDEAHRPVKSNMQGDSTPSRTGTPRVRESDPVPKDEDRRSPDLFSRPDAQDSAAETQDHGNAADADAATPGREPSDSRQTPDSETDPRATSPNDASSEDAGEPATEATDEDDGDKPRPRREIIAEEMQAADEHGHHLALALIHLNRAESIARSGMDAVETAETALRARLQAAAPDQRVVRFGELTYGVFFRAGLDRVEPWAINLQDRMDAATGTLEGGASIGVALRSARHDDPDALRADATRALREAYETGTCTIIE